MKLLVRQATILSPSSPHHGTKKDILVENGILSKIANRIEASDEVRLIESGNLHVSIGWMDCFANFCEPGFESRETIDSGIKAAAAGGFTDVLLVPDTRPATDNKSQVDFLKNRSQPYAVNIHPIGAVSKNLEGKELAEMYDMRRAGAAAFGDGFAAVQNSGLMLKALQYISAFNGVIIQIPDDRQLRNNGLMHEGVISTQLGLPGIPSLAEEISIERDLKLAAYTNSHIHFTGISTSRGIERIQEAKKEGIRVSCSVTPYHLFFCDEDLQDYDTHLKVIPPLRSSSDRNALATAFLEGTIDCLASHHQPCLTDEKKCEFEYAKAGMAAIQQAFSSVCTLTKNQQHLSTLIEKMTLAPRNIFGLPIPEIKENAEACLTLFDPTLTYVPSESGLLTQASNNAFLGKQLTGKPIGIVNKNQFIPAP